MAEPREQKIVIPRLFTDNMRFVGITFMEECASVVVKILAIL
jgi:hypothetical protein